MSQQTERVLRGLTIKQPWASLIAQGHKTIENRTWSTAHRGPLVIVAGRTTDPEGLKLATRLGIELDQKLPTGLVCVVDLVDVRPVSDLTPEERRDPFASGPYCWTLKRPRLLKAPVLYPGNVRLIRVPWSKVVRSLPADVAAELRPHLQVAPRPA